jgi:hypothetical protein
MQTDNVKPRDVGTCNDLAAIARKYQPPVNLDAKMNIRDPVKWQITVRYNTPRISPLALT